MTLEIQQTSEIEHPFSAWFLYGPMGSGKTRAAATFDRPLFLIPANEGSELTLAQFKQNNLPFVKIGKDVAGNTIRARQHFGQILTDLEKRHAEMQRLWNAAGLLPEGPERDAMEAASDAAFPWRTLVAESLTHLGDMLVEDVSDFGKKKMDQQGWGLISNFYRTLHSRLRNMDVNLVYTALAATVQNEDGGIIGGGPNLIGSMKEKLPSACDVVVYMEELPGARNAAGETPPVYRSFFRKYKVWQARTRFGNFPDYMDNFNYQELKKLFVPT